MPNPAPTAGLGVGLEPGMIAGSSLGGDGNIRDDKDNDADADADADADGNGDGDGDGDADGDGDGDATFSGWASLVAAPMSEETPLQAAG